jgi:small subunit ribosomal protein S6
MRDYELVLLIKPDMNDKNIESLLSEVKVLITNDKAQKIKSENIQKKALAYPIKKYNEAYYATIQISLEPDNIAKIKGVLKLNEKILRYDIGLMKKGKKRERGKGKGNKKADGK